MPPALEIITANVTAAAAAGSAMAAVPGDSLIVRAAPQGKRIRLLNMWVDCQTSGFFQVTSTKMHDATRGLRFATLAASVEPMLPTPANQDLYEQDTLALTLAEGAVAGDIGVASLLVYYEDLLGQQSRLIDAPTLAKRGVETVTVDQTLALLNAGGYSGSEAINAESDLLKANTDYAFVGYRVSTQCCTVAWRGADTGNLRVGGPGNQLGHWYTEDWFLRLSERYGLPMIPVFNSANKGNIQVDGAQDENGADVEVTAILVRLS